jgi:hypothetical protein
MLGSYRARLSEEYAIFNKAKHLVYCPTYIDQGEIRTDLTMIKACCGKYVSAGELQILTGLPCLFGGQIFFGIYERRLALICEALPKQRFCLFYYSSKERTDQAWRMLKTISMRTNAPWKDQLGVNSQKNIKQCFNLLYRETFEAVWVLSGEIIFRICKENFT